MEPLISVVIPTYKRPMLLENCLNCLGNQILDKKYYEVIVVSDGPDPETESLINQRNKETNLRIQFLSLSAHQGPAGARNTGWKAANGKIIAFTDDDCLPAPYWLSEAIMPFRNGTKVAIGKVIVPTSENPTDFELNTKNLEQAQFVTANCFIAKGLLHEVGGFDERFEMAFREDSDLQFRLTKKGVEIKKIESALVTHPVRVAPWWVSIKDQKKSMFNALLFKKHPLEYRSSIQSSPPWLYYLIILSLGLSLIFPLFLLLWAFLTTVLLYQRTKPASHSLSHFLTTLATSIAIPFLSVFWRIYGSLKYKVFFF